MTATHASVLTETQPQQARNFQQRIELQKNRSKPLLPLTARTLLNRSTTAVPCASTKHTQVRKWVLTPNVPAPPPKPFVTHKTRTWVMLNWRVAAGSNEEVTAYVVSWRLGRKGNFDDELTVRTAQFLMAESVSTVPVLHTSDR